MAMEYDVNSEKQLVVREGVRSESYDLTKPMGENALMVKTEKQDILHQMDLPTVISNLNNTVDLLNISYHAVYGFPEQSQVFGLQKGVMDLNDKGIVVVTDFKDQASVVVAELVGVYRWLIKGMESVAISKLEQFASRAAGMSEQATEMADGYQAAADRTSAVLQKVMDQNAAQVEKSAELTRMMKELEAAQESVAAIQKSVEERLSGMNQEYRRLVKVDEDVRSHKQTMDIMGAVFGFLGSAVSVAGAAMGAGSTVGTGTSGSDMQGQQDYAEAESDKKDLERQFEDKEQEISDLEKKVQDLIAEKDAAEETEKERLEKEISAARKKFRGEKGKRKPGNQEKSRRRQAGKVRRYAGRAGHADAAGGCRRSGRGRRSGGSDERHLHRDYESGKAEDGAGGAAGQVRQADGGHRHRPAFHRGSHSVPDPGRILPEKIRGGAERYRIVLVLPGEELPGAGGQHSQG